MVKRRLSTTNLDLGKLRSTAYPSDNRDYSRAYNSEDVLQASQGNPAPYKQGGLFMQHSRKTYAYPTDASITTKRLYQTYTGRFVDDQYRLLGGQLAYPSQGEIDYYGAKGWARYKPDRPVQDVGTIIGEFHEFEQLGRLYKEGSKSLAERILDREFGRGAAIRDILKLKSLQEDLDKRMKALLRNNGKPVRREGTITQDVSSSVSQINTPGPGVYPTLTWGMSGPTRRTLITTTQYRWWFSGRFRWWIPEFRTSKSGGWPPLLTAHLTGFNLEAAWNLMPWSWLIDWFSNYGDVLSNILSVGQRGLVADYAYVMNERLVRDESRTDFMWQGVQHMPTSSFRETSTKLRQHANPFGFGVSGAGFTPERAAILASLAITRSADGKIVPW